MKPGNTRKPQCAVIGRWVRDAALTDTSTLKRFDHPSNRIRLAIVHWNLLLCAITAATARPIQAAPPASESGRIAQTYATRGGTVSFDFDEGLLRTLGWQFTSQGPVGEVSHESHVTLAVRAASSLSIRSTDGAVFDVYGGSVRLDGALLLLRDRGARYAIGKLSMEPGTDGRWQVWSALDESASPLAAFDLVDVLIDFVPSTRRIRLAGSLAMAAPWADKLGAPHLAGRVLGTMVLDAATGPANERIAAGAEEAGTSSAAEAPSALTSSGPDVIVGELLGTESFGNNLNGISAFAVGTISCNIGDQRLDWHANSNRHPVIAQNMFRLKNGRFEQIGMSWLKHGFFATSQSLCEVCQDPTDGTQLGVGCSDPYTAHLNGIQSNLSPRSTINPHTGDFPYPWDGWSGPPDNSNIGRRLQVHDADIDPNLNPDAVYFLEGQYITADDATAGNGDNNASYRPVLVSQAAGDFTFTLTGFTHRKWPGLYAWRTQDPGVLRLNIHVPDDGTFAVAGKATDRGGGLWHYEYAVQNLNSERAARAFIVPLEPGATVSNIGFHDIDYHSGESFDGTDWTGAVIGDTITWSTSEFSVDPNANALRWGTLYNFWFDADVPPSDSTATIALFKPGTPATDSTPMIGPVLPPPACNNGVVDPLEQCDPPDGVLCDAACQLFPNDALRGGLLWDTWWKVADALEPTGQHPLYPPGGLQSGSQTFRCVECHGWDYKGVDGAYGTGPHFTGIPGVLSSTRTPVEMFDLIKNDTAPNGHGFGQLSLTDQDIRDLVQFVLDLAIDSAPYLDGTGAFTADPVQGQTNYETIGSPTCSTCHGADGTAINTGTFETPQWVGTTSVNDPQRFFHRVRFGIPGESMPSWLGGGGTDNGVAEIGRYAQLNLPSVCTADLQCNDGLFCNGEELCVAGTCVRGPVPCPAAPCSEIDNLCGAADSIRGGRLYDKWWVVLNATPPVGNHPLYPPAGTQTGSMTYRCKECHGWDYKGVDGAYGAGTHFTGIRGVFGSSMTAADMFDTIMTNSVANGHDFESLGLSVQDGWDLVSFLQSLVIDTDGYIDPAAQFLGDEIQGQVNYTSAGTVACIACHGADGTAIDFGTPGAPEWIGTIAVANPWELLHKIRIGQPGAPMPSWVLFGGTDQGAADIGRYAQLSFPVDCRNDADCTDGLFCTGVETCPDRFCVPGNDPCPGEVCDENLGACLSGTCDPPIVDGAGSRYLGIIPQPIDSLVPMRLMISSPDWPCIAKYVGGVLRCDGTGAECALDAECNRCSISADPCLLDSDCMLVGENCTISGQICIPGIVEPIDINNDGIADGTFGMLVDDPADAAVLTPAEWGASLRRCTKSYAVCGVDEDCDRGVCLHPDCGPNECTTPCSMIAQDCLSFCDDSTQHACTTPDDCGSCSTSGRTCRFDEDCFPPGQTCDPSGVACIFPTCFRNETCEPGRAYVGGSDIVPSDHVFVNGNEVLVGTRYEARADCGSPGNPQFSLAAETTTWLWADVDNNGTANFADIQLMVLGFQGSFGLGNLTTNTLLGADIVGASPCNPERVVNFGDIQAAVFAFGDEHYAERLDAGSCSGDGSPCSVSAQNCPDLSVCRSPHDCALPCPP